MLSCIFCKWLLILSFRQFLTCVFSFVAQAQAVCVFLCRQDCAHLRRGCFIQRGVQIQCLLHAPAVVSKLFQVRRRKHNVHGKQKYKPACGDPWRGDSQACPVLNKSLRRQYVDDNQTTGAQSPLIKWQFACCKVLYHLGGRAFHDGPQQKLTEQIG